MASNILSPHHMVFFSVLGVIIQTFKIASGFSQCHNFVFVQDTSNERDLMEQLQMIQQYFLKG